MTFPCLRGADGQNHSLDKRLATIGSDKDCQICLSGPGVRPQHAFLLFKAGHWNLRPLESAATVLVDGVVVQEETSLTHGQSIDVGGVVLHYLERDEVASGLAEVELPLVGLLEAVASFVRSTDSKTACLQMAQAAARQIQADGVRVIYRPTGEGLWRTVAAFPAGAPSQRFSERALRQAESAGRIIRMGQTELADLPAGESIQVNGIRSIMCVPLRLPDGEEGFMYADRLAGNPSFNAEEEQIFGALSSLFGEVAALMARTERQRNRIETLEQAVANTSTILHASEGMVKLLKEASRVAGADVPVHIFGETGTGKELLARFIHDSSRRSQGPFIPINCGAIPENLVESELFGHAKGAFTGAGQKRVGWIEKASGGTLFLDEMGELPAALQVKLLRVLQEGEVVPVGGDEAVRVDFRLVTATHRDLKAEVDAGRFRADLYWRLHVVRLELPALRARGADALLLAQHFLAKFSARHGVGARSFSRAAEKSILEHPWPGNVRELENVVQKAVLLASDERIVPRDLGLAGDDPDSWGGMVDLPDDQTLHGARERAEREAIVAALRTSKGNVSLAARILDADRKVLIRSLERLQIEPSAFK